MSHIRLCIIGDCLIEVDGTPITPSASHLFGLLLILAIEDRRWLSRREIRDLLFVESAKPDLASHSLRQLLYRLRQMGVCFDERPSGFRLRDAQVLGPLELLQPLGAEERALIPPVSLRVLPSYSPKLSPAFAEWVERVRDATELKIKHLFLSDHSRLRAAHSWEPLARLSSTLRELDPLNEDVAIAGAEALAMVGRRYEALEVLDTFAQEADNNSPHSGELRRLRARISNKTIEKREPRFFGRNECLALLDAEWEDAEEGGARLVVIVGAAGLGKTRVVDEFASKIVLRTATVIHHRCDGQSRDCPLSLFSQILPTLRSLRGSIGIAPHYQSLLDRLRPSHNSSPTPMPQGVSLEVLRADLQSALVDVLEAVSSEQRILITVDDAHLLDDASCDLLHHLSTSINCAALLVVACCRPREHALGILEPGERTTLHLLAPLAAGASRDLFLALVADRDFDREHLDWCLKQSAGNPFYLHALARHSATGTIVPFDVNSLASSSYFALAASERLVLESCLFLESFATLTRVGLVAGLDDLSLAAALRQLEDQALVCLVDQTVRGPHSLLDDAIRSLIPTTVSALLHKRLAEVLADECTSSEYSSSLALAAARHWLAAGEISAALVLTRRCAAEAAAIGEPAAAADLLSQMLHAVLPTETRRAILDDLITYADAGGSRVLAAQSLRDRLVLGRSTNESPEALARFELRIIEADILNGADLLSAVPRFIAILDHSDSDHDVRMQCVVNLLVIADAEYDSSLANWLFNWMSGHASNGHPASASALRAHLVYHTTFGSVDLALAIVQDIIRRFPTPLLDEDCRTARRFASYSLYRMMMAAHARSILESDYHFMRTHAIRSEALYAASLLTEIAIGEGDFCAADYWFSETGRQVRGISAHKLSPNSGYYSSAALLAMMQGRYGDAEQLIAMPQAEDARMQTARYEAICCALSLRLCVMRGDIHAHQDLIARLKELYNRGRSLGGQDTVVEQLWCVEILAGREQAASALLSTYLSEYRRESFPLEWSLCHTTAADETWNNTQRPVPVDINRRLVARDCALSVGGNSHFQKSLASN